MEQFFTLGDAVLSVHRARILVATAIAQGADRDALFANTGLPPQLLDVPETRLTYGQLDALARGALRLTGNPALAIDVGRNTRFAQLGVLGPAVMSGATAGATLAALLPCFRSVDPAFEPSLSSDGELARLQLRETVALGPLRSFAIEWWLASFATVSHELLGRPLPVRELRFAFQEPAHATRYRELCDVPMRFECSATELRFDAVALEGDLAFSGKAPALRGSASIPGPVTARSAQPQVASLLDQVRRSLDGAHGRPPRLRELARELQTSARTLNRELQGMGTSYRQLLDASRRGRAIEWVRASDMTTVQIANELGFSDVRGFRRAFKRWTGELPTSMRAAVNIGGQSPPSVTRA